MLKNVFLSLALCLSAAVEAQVVVTSPPTNFAGMKKVTIKNCTTTTGVRVRQDMHVRSKDNRPTRMVVTVSADGQKFYQLEEDFLATPPTEVLYLKKEGVWYLHDYPSKDFDKTMEDIFAKELKAPTQEDRHKVTCRQAMKK